MTEGETSKMAQARHAMRIFERNYRDRRQSDARADAVHRPDCRRELRPRNDLTLCQPETEPYFSNHDNVCCSPASAILHQLQWL